MFQTRSLGTPYYNAPEFEKSAKFTPKVDIWALGAVFFELHDSGLEEFCEMAHESTTIQNLTLRRLAEMRKERTCPLLKFIDEYMLQPMPEKRASASECLADAEKLDA